MIPQANSKVPIYSSGTEDWSLYIVVRPGLNDELGVGLRSAIPDVQSAVATAKRA